MLYCYKKYITCYITLLGVVSYMKSWKLSYFNQVKYETIRILCEKLSIEFKKKAAEVCEIQNVLPSHMVIQVNHAIQTN